MPQTCENLATSDEARPSLFPIGPSQFQRRLTIATQGLLLVVLLGFVLYICSSILQPLFIAGLLVYLILPVHQRLVRWWVPSVIAYLLIVVSVLALFWGIGQLTYRNFAELSGDRLSLYEERLDVQTHRPTRNRILSHFAGSKSRRTRRPNGPAKLRRLRNLSVPTNRPGKTRLWPTRLHSFFPSTHQLDDADDTDAGGRAARCL